MKEMCVKDLLNTLDTIQAMCVGEVAMGCKLDAAYISNLIYTATGMTAPELAEHCKANINSTGENDEDNRRGSIRY